MAYVGQKKQKHFDVDPLSKENDAAQTHRDNIFIYRELTEYNSRHPRHGAFWSNSSATSPQPI
jgi:hypothetical protein